MTHAEMGPSTIVVKPGEGKHIHVLGAEIVVKIPSRATAGAFTVFEGLTRPQHGPPLHRHPDQDEWWHILDGDFRFVVDGRDIRASTGDVVFAPRGSAHTFQNIGHLPGRTLATAVRGGVDEFFEELEKVAPPGTAPNPFAMMPVFEKYRQELLGPPLGSAK